jgi:hypothetical protein
MSAEEPNYREAVAIGWRILWRGVGSFLLLLFVANLAVFALLPELTRTAPSIWALLLSAACVMPFVVRGLLRTPFRNFHLEFVRDRAETIDRGATPPFHHRRNAEHETDHRNRHPLDALAQPDGDPRDIRRAG